MRRRLQLPREAYLAVALVVVMLVMSGLSEYFFTVENLLKMTRYRAEVGIVACAMTLIIMTGGIDLSVGSLLALCSIVLGYAWQVWGLGAAPAIALAIVTGAAGGAFNGMLVTRCNLPPLVVTLATMALFRGLAFGVSKADPVSGFPDAFTWLGQGSVLGLPVQLVVWVVLALATVVLVSRTATGRVAVAIGDNVRAATFAALKVRLITFSFYVGCGVLCAIAALIYTARTSTAKPDAYLGMELDVITAVVLGGTAITGGRGTALGTFLGVLILGIIRNGLTLAGVPSVWQETTAGSILIVMAVLNQRLGGRLSSG